MQKQEILTNPKTCRATKQDERKKKKNDKHHIRPNAISIYTFLIYIRASQKRGELGEQISVLDCGAGGEIPPLALFAEHGIDAHGIDISEDQLEKAKQYCAETGIRIDLRAGDMRKIPYGDEEFDCVYEHYSMCHLSKLEIANVIREMYRVTKKNGLCFLGVISVDSWPKRFYGEEKELGEYWVEEFGKLTRHSMFSDDEADQLVAEWDILSKEKRVMYLRNAADDVTNNIWMEMFVDEGDGFTEAECGK